MVSSSSNSKFSLHNAASWNLGSSWICTALFGLPSRISAEGPASDPAGMGSGTTLPLNPLFNLFGCTYHGPVLHTRELWFPLLILGPANYELCLVLWMATYGLQNPESIFYRSTGTEWEKLTVPYLKGGRTCARPSFSTCGRRWTWAFICRGTIRPC
jgi:hypothetical protein